MGALTQLDGGPDDNNIPESAPQPAPQLSSQPAPQGGGLGAMLPAMGKPVSAMDQLNNLMLQRMQQTMGQQQPLADERASTLRAYQDAVQNAGRLDPMIGALRGAAAGADSSGDPSKVVKGWFGGLEDTRAENANRDARTSGIGYTDVTGRQTMANEQLRDSSIAIRSMALSQSKMLKVVPGVGLVDYRDPSNPQVIVPQSLLPQYQKIYEAAYKEATDNRMDNPEDYADSVARRAIQGAPQGVMGGHPAIGDSPTTAGQLPFGAQGPGVTTGGSPLPTAQPAQPGATAQPAAPAQSTSPDVSVNLPNGQKFTGSIQDAMMQSKQLANAGDISSAKAIQDVVLAAMKDQQSQTTQPTTLKYKDLYGTAADTATGKEIGEQLGKAYPAIVQNGADARKLMTQLDLLDKLDQNPNMPQGEKAKTLQSIRSTLSTLGVPDAGKNAAPADIYQSIASNISASMRSSLFPGGRITNYEEGILQAMGPTITHTQEGRAVIRGIMSDIARSNAAMSDAAIDYASKHGGRLDSGWLPVANRIGTEQTVRMMRNHAPLLAPLGLQPTPTGAVPIPGAQQQGADDGSQ